MTTIAQLMQWFAHVMANYQNADRSWVITLVEVGEKTDSSCLNPNHLELGSRGKNLTDERDLDANGADFALF